MVHLIKAKETILVSENDDRIAAADRSAKFSGRCPRSIRGISRIVTDSSVLESELSAVRVGSWKPRDNLTLVWHVRMIGAL